MWSARLTGSSLYFFWSYHSPSKGVFDFETPGKNIQGLFDAAKDAGLWVIARAGPYCNVSQPHLGWCHANEARPRQTEADSLYGAPMGAWATSGRVMRLSTKPGCHGSRRWGRSSQRTRSGREA